MREVAIAGVALVRFFRYDGEKGRPYKESYELGAEAINKVLKYAEMEWKDIQAVYAGNMFGGLAVGQQCVSRIGMPGLPIINVEGACSTSQQAMREVYLDIANGAYDIGLALGVEKIPGGLIEDTLAPVWKRQMGINTPPGSYGLETTRYMKDYGATAEDIARVAVMERKNAILNPNAFWYQGPQITVEQVMNSRLIAAPLTFLMTCANGDGASAAILCSKNKLKSRNKMVTIAASAHVTGTYGSTPIGEGPERINPNEAERATKKVWEMSGYGPEDMDVIQLYEAMAPAFLWNAHYCGFCKPGESAKLLREGYFEIGGKLPANTDGGLMGRSHPTGATGLAQIAELFYQLRGEGGPRQVPGNPKIAFNHVSGGGPNAVCNVLKR